MDKQKVRMVGCPHRLVSVGVCSTKSQIVKKQPSTLDGKEEDKLIFLTPKRSSFCFPLDAFWPDMISKPVT